MKKQSTIIAVVNQKGGTAKTTTVENLGIGLSRQNKKVLLIDTDPQASLTISLGYPRPDDLELTLSDLLNGTISENPVALDEVLIHQREGIDLIPSNISLAGLEVSLVNTMNRERILKQFLEPLRERYDYILLDCMPSLGMLTVNALAASDATLVPVQANYLSAKGLEQLLSTINQVKRQINPKLCIEGILITMVDARTNYAKDISNLIRNTYCNKITVFKTEIPRSVRAAETSAEGKSIFAYDPSGKVAEAYESLTQEVLKYDQKSHRCECESQCYL